MTCLVCENDFELDEFPFGGNVTCPHCGAVLETEWDYTDGDGSFAMACWPIRILSEGEKGV